MRLMLEDGREIRKISIGNNMYYGPPGRQSVYLMDSMSRDLALTFARFGCTDQLSPLFGFCIGYWMAKGLEDICD